MQYKKVYHVVGNDELMVASDGTFYNLKENQIVKITKQNVSEYAKYVINTFIGPFNGKICYLDKNKFNISSKNLYYELNIEKINDEILIINNQEFKQIPGFSNYYISKYGVVYGVKYNKLLRIKINKTNYYTIGITNDSGHRKFMMIHRLVYVTWRGYIPYGYEINHKNSQPWINYVDNLEISTSLENVRYSIKYNNRYSKWDSVTVYKICKFISEGYTPDEIRNLLVLDDVITKKDFRSFCDNLKNKTKYWKDISSQFDFSNAYSNLNKRKYSDDFIYKVLDLIDKGVKLIDISNKFNVDIRVISDIKRGVKKPFKPRK